jgi:hypothetical protein
MHGNAPFFYSTCYGEVKMVALNNDEIQLISGGGGHEIVTDCFGSSEDNYNGYDADEALDALIQFLSY